MTQLARFRHQGRERLGVVTGAHLIDVTTAFAARLAWSGPTRSREIASEIAHEVIPPDLLQFLRGGQATRTALDQAITFTSTLDRDTAERAGILVPASDATLLVPIPNPPKIICVARNYGKHADEAGLEISEIPILFARFAATQIAHGEPIIVPTVSEQLDWEGELAVVIGRGGRVITRDRALEHVAGYTIFNDVTVRDYQFRVTQYTAGKNFHASGPVGPTVTLADDSLDPHNLQITTTVNGVVKQSASTSELIFDIPFLIEHISEFIELEAGDIIPTGTPAGVGFKRNPPEFLRHGDTVSVSIDGLGTLTNPVRNDDQGVRA